VGDTAYTELADSSALKDEFYQLASIRSVEQTGSFRGTNAYMETFSIGGDAAAWNLLLEDSLVELANFNNAKHILTPVSGTPLLPNLDGVPPRGDVIPAGFLPYVGEHKLSWVNRLRKINQVALDIIRSLK
jgi:hypothetical protein